MQNKQQADFKKQVQQVLEIISELELNSEFFHSETTSSEADKWDEGPLQELKDKLRELGISYTQEAQHGGEGEGDQYWSVFSFTDGAFIEYVKFSGWYASYNGAEYEENFFVVPKQFMVTRYFPA